jgi:hypothetical protein
MQPNMSEGKSSVIVPTVAAALADGSRLVYIIVDNPQSEQMFQILVSKLESFLDRQVYHMLSTKEFPDSIKVSERWPGSCPRTRVLSNSLVALQGPSTRLRVSKEYSRYLSYLSNYLQATKQSIRNTLLFKFIYK